MRNLTKAVLTIVVLSATARESLAQVVPYKTKGTGVYFPATGEYSGSGTGTHMGKHTFIGFVSVSPTADPLVYNFESTFPQITIAANGDTILFDVTGQVQFIPLDSTFTTFSAIWTAAFTVVGGTGRFANVAPAAQPLTGIAINNPFTFAESEWTFSWTLDGSIALH
jgi:hypothetical protein